MKPVAVAAAVLMLEVKLVEDVVVEGFVVAVVVL